MSSLADCPLVLVTGIFTFTFGPHPAIVRACSAMLAKSSANSSNETGRSGAAATLVSAEDSFALGAADPGLPHQCRIGGEALDHGVLRHFYDAFIVGTVAENLHIEIGDPAHGPSCAV